MSQALCPVLGTNQNNLITQNNVDSLLLDTYARTEGTVVKVACYVPSVYRLDGPSTVQCNSSGTWVPSIPTCVKRTASTGGGDATSTASPVDLTSTQNTVVSTSTILLIVTSVVAFILLAVVFLLIYKLTSGRSNDIKQWQALNESNQEEPYHQKPKVSVVSPVPSPAFNTPSNTWHQQPFQKPHSMAPSWHSHPIIASGQSFDYRTWRQFSVDRFLQNLERSRRENPNHSWRDFTTVSTRLSTSTV